MEGGYRIHRKEAVGMEALIREYIRGMKIEAGVDRQLVYSIWDRVSGAGDYTLGRFFSDGVLYVTLSSSVVRSQLYFQKDTLLRAVNDQLREDSLFSGAEKNIVKSIVFK